jgi:hypothetical protein
MLHAYIKKKHMHTLGVAFKINYKGLQNMQV